MAQSHLFPNAYDLSPEEHAFLADAYERACDDLRARKGYSAEELAKLVEPMTVAILALYRAGQRDETQLIRYAAFKALFRDSEKTSN